MIVSHLHKFIFIKTKKTAGTSVEIALSSICGDQDIITPITFEDEEIRRSLGYRGPQNHFVNGVQQYYNHMPAKEIKLHVGDATWESYFKFCFERNPWDKVISWYFWENRTEPRPSLSAFIRSGKAGLVGGPGGYDLYSIDGRIAVDKVCLYERMDQEIEAIQHLRGLPKIPPLPRAKSRFRSDQRSYREVYGQQDRFAVEALFKREIEHFGYRF